MKTIYELVFRTLDGKEHNLLFSSKRKAERNLKENYNEGAYIGNQKITHSFVVDRLLF